jgi:hypothetical protein
MSTATSYPIRLEKKIIDSVRPIAKREGRTIKAQIERIIAAAVGNDQDDPYRRRVAKL